MAGPHAFSHPVHCGGHVHAVRSALWGSVAENTLHCRNAAATHRQCHQDVELVVTYMVDDRQKVVLMFNVLVNIFLKTIQVSQHHCALTANKHERYRFEN